MTAGVGRGVAEPLLDRACMRKRIREQLVARILDGRYEPGLHLKELTLAREFNVSQAPVREALRELETLGLVTSEPYRGTRVRGVDLREMREAYELRALIEADSAARAVPCAAGFCDELSGYVQGMRESIASGNREAHADAALRFHRRLVEAGGNRTFLATWDSFHWHVRARLTMSRIDSTAGDFGGLIPLHEGIIEQLRAGDGPGAANAVRSSFVRFIEMFSAGA